MIYYAKSKNNDGKQETLEHHLIRTSELCESFASKFNESEIGKTLGLCHDAGKRTDSFQNVLIHKETKVNHCLAGAVFMQRAYMGTGCIVNGHHKCLDTNITIKNDINKTNKIKEESYDINDYKISVKDQNELKKIEEMLINLGVDLNTKKLEKFSSKNKNMFFLRMLYSCLIDADFSASAECDNPNYLKESTGPDLDYNFLLKKLETFRDNIIKNTDPLNNINILRNMVYNDCSENAEKPPGLFTLTAPTGTAKTLAMLKFALEHAKKYKKERIIFVLPFLSIIEQNANIYKQICGNEYVLEDTSQTEFVQNEREYSERWSSPVIVTTSVNFFESLFKNKHTKCRKLHNIANSVIVFDEAQSLSGNILGCTLEIMNFLCEKFNSSIVFSTATQPSYKYRKDITWNPTEIIKDTNLLYSLYEKSKKIDVVWDIFKETSFDEISDNMINCNNVCTIVNKKKHAIDIYNKLISKNNPEECFYISTNMATKNRIDIINIIKYRIKNNLKCLVVSTQCIEAGVDLDFDVIYRALSPLESIIQAGGRCNRNGTKDGKLIVFIPEGEKKYPSIHYENASKQVLGIYDINKNININSLTDIDNYYRYYFNICTADHDKKEITKAILDEDFNKISLEYKIIDNNNNNSIIVPYNNKELETIYPNCNLLKEPIEIFKKIETDLRNNNYIINKNIMKQAATITVNCYNEEFCQNNCIPLFIKNEDGNPIKSGWYILSNPSLYDSKTGLLIENDINFIF